MLVIDLLRQAAHERPHQPLLPGLALSNAEAWARSGSVASWLIAQGYGPGGGTVVVPSGERPQRVVMLLGALRAGALVVDGLQEDMEGLRYGVLANCPVDAAVAERRLHIDAGTPARQIGGVLRRHGDFATIADALA